MHFTIDSSPVAADEVTERVDSVGDLEEDGSSSVGRSVETSSEDSEEEETDPQVKEEVGCGNDGISCEQLCVG